MWTRLPRVMAVRELDYRRNWTVLAGMNGSQRSITRAFTPPYDYPLTSEYCVSDTLSCVSVAPSRAELASVHVRARLPRSTGVPI